MIAGMDRYFQMARCFRDEDLRADRQPEFSQIDIEASFIDVPTMTSLMEGLIARIWREVMNVELKLPFRRMPYQEAMGRYGSDKPDLRFGLEIQDLAGVFAKSSFQVLKSASFVRAIVVPGAAEKISRKDIDELQAQAALYGAKGLLWIKFQAQEIQSPAAKHLSTEEVQTLRQKLKVKEGDLALFVADAKEKAVAESLGAVRLALGRKLGLLPKSHHDRYEFVWVTDFPLLEFDETERRYFACHHPFTSPVPECIPDFVEGKNLGEMRASAYDLVLNGTEVGGGSLRIFNSAVQDAMFKNLGITAEEAQQKFGFFLEALKYGTPPHGGIAFGIDRLAAILSDVDAIRDVMAFPKTQRGTDLMAESPSTLAQAQLLELGLSVRKTTS
jgi:aspartyl-tRNA synthetase